MRRHDDPSIRDPVAQRLLAESAVVQSREDPVQVSRSSRLQLAQEGIDRGGADGEGKDPVGPVQPFSHRLRNGLDHHGDPLTAADARPGQPVTGLAAPQLS